MPSNPRTDIDPASEDLIMEQTLPPETSLEDQDFPLELRDDKDEVGNITEDIHEFVEASRELTEGKKLVEGELSAEFMRPLIPQLAHLCKSLDTLPKISLDEHKTSDPTTHPDILENRLDDLFEEAQEIAASSQHLLEKLQKELYPQLETLDLKEPGNRRQLARIFSNIVATIDQINANHTRIINLGRESLHVKKDYIRAKLYHVAGVTDLDQLQEKMGQLSNQAQQLRTTKIGRWRHKKKLQEISQKLDEMRQAAWAFTEWGIYSENSLEPIFYYIEDGRIQHMPKELVSRQNQVNREGKEIVHTLVNKFSALFMGQLEEFQKLAVASAETGAQTEALPEESIDSLNREYLDRNFLPLVHDLIQNGGYYNYSERQALSDPAKLQEAEDLIKDIFATPPPERNWDQRFGQDRIALQARIDTLPEVFTNLLNGTHYLDRVAYGRWDGCYREMAYFAKNATVIIEAEGIFEPFSQVLGGLADVLEKSGRSLYAEAWPLRREQQSIEEIPLRKKLQQFINDLDTARWEVFRHNGLAQEQFGRENITALDQYISKTIIAKLLSAHEHSDESVKLGYQLRSYTTPATVPIFILNAFREPGYSGEDPFLRCGGREHATNMELYKYIESIDDSTMLALKESAIPGLEDLIKLIKEHPGSVSYNKIWSADRTTHKQDPIYYEIQRAVLKTAGHYLEHGDEDTQFFIVGLLKRINVDLGSTYQTMGEIIRSTKTSKLQQNLIECVTWRAHVGDIKAVEVLVESFNSLDTALQEKIRHKAPEFLTSFTREIPGDEQDDKHYAMNQNNLDSLAGMLGINPTELTATIDFLREIPGFTEPGWGASYDPRLLKDYVLLANNPSIIPFIKEANQRFNYCFQIGHAAVLPGLTEEQDVLFDQIQTIKSIFPDFHYRLPYDIEYNHQTKDTETIYKSNPYEVLFKQQGLSKTLDTLSVRLKEQGDISPEFYSGLLMYLRSRDRFYNRRSSPEQVDATHIRLFQEAIHKILIDPPGVLGEGFINEDILHFISRQPERVNEVIDLPNTVPELFELIKPGGPLCSNQPQVFRDIFVNGNAVRRAKEIVTIFTRKLPYWKQLHFFTDLRIGDQLAASISRYPIDQVGDASLSSLIERHRVTKKENPQKVTRLEKIVPHPEIVEQLLRGEINAIPFYYISGIYKRLIFRNYLRQTIESSRSVAVKNAADQRNRETAPYQFEAYDGMYIHGSPIDVLPAVLQNGNLPGEALGESASMDSYPFHVDFTVIKQHFIDQQESLQNTLLRSNTGNYGTRGEYGSNGQIFYIYNRENTNWEKGKDYGPSDHQRLLMGGMPATEVSAIILKSPETTLNITKRRILENGFYIPVYDLEGKMIFSVHEYDAIRDDLNLKVQVEVWDYSLKTGEQLGSNPGAEFTVPGKGGPIKHYVKFSKSDYSDHLWNEQLADNIYRQLSIAVPDTQIVRVEGSYGHASRLIDLDEKKEILNMNAGFIADILLANWDIVYNPANNSVSNGETYRLDNGGALIFHARGARKTPEEFGATVGELEVGNDVSRLGTGMRQKYPGLTDRDIHQQVLTLKEKLTDEIIHELVDGVRLTRADRDYLKDILKARRDYILQKVLGHQKTDTLSTGQKNRRQRWGI